MKNVQAINDHTFEVEVEDYNDKPVAVLFHTHTGIPCQHFRVVFDKIADTHKEHFKFVSIDCNVYTEVAKPLVGNSFPCVAFFNEGKYLTVARGAMDIAFFSQTVNRILSKTRRAKAEQKSTQ